MKNIVYVLLVLQCCYSIRLLARFSHQIVDHFDLNEAIKNEHYIDIMSYQPPFVWNHFWIRSLNTYRNSMGSLDYRRYNYLGDIKIYSNNDHLVKFEYTQKTEETIDNFFVEKNMKMLFNVYDNIYISLMTEPKTYKKFIDYGLSLSYETSPQDRIELYYWLIDLEYNKKETIDTDRYAKKSYTVGVNITHNEQNIHMDLNLEYDSPHIWQVKSRGFSI